ncbi:MAG: ParB/RepB/Spo0J family partition protein, partial [Pseudomonadota bacterium]|nr:ParB/RepB/Spo0J family partition protein [Pseudomonadota bacterium]
MAKKSDSPSSKKASGKQTDAAAASAQKVVAKQRGLGRGLSSLLGDAGAAATMTSASAGATPAAAAPQSGLVDIPIEWINSGPWQPRRRFDIAALEELADSIRSKGLVQPVLVRPHTSKTNRYELIAGERRWRAAQMAQLHNVPAIIRDFSDEEAYEVALIENVQRADLNVIEEADGYRQLIENFGYTQGKLSEI